MGDRIVMQVERTICDFETCARPGCSKDAGCQGHAWRELAPESYANRARELVAMALRDGVVITIEQVPRLPLAMGNYATVVSVREARDAGTPRAAAVCADPATSVGSAANGDCT